MGLKKYIIFTLILLLLIFIYIKLNFENPLDAINMFLQEIENKRFNYFSK